MSTSFASETSCNFAVTCDTTYTCHGPFGISATPVNYSPSSCTTVGDYCYFCEYGDMQFVNDICTCSNNAACNRINAPGKQTNIYISVSLNTYMQTYKYKQKACA